MGSNMLAWIGVFVFSSVLSVCWAKYLIEIEQRRAVRAALWDCGLVLGSALVIIGYVHDPWLLVPNLLGAFIGTYVTVKFTRRTS